MDRLTAEAKFRLFKHRHVVVTVLFLALVLVHSALSVVAAHLVSLSAMIASAWLMRQEGEDIRYGVILASLPVVILAVSLALIPEAARDVVDRALSYGTAIAVLLMLLYCAFVILVRLLRMTEITENEIFASVNLFLMIGFVWAYMYALLESYSPGAFAAGDTSHPLETRFIYFSFVTLTTLGFGDIVPRIPIAESLVILEAIIGEVYVAVVVTYLLSVHITQKAGLKAVGSGEEQ
ncbi:potassium channel family protein [Thermodesulfobacteriota bacterium]